MEGLNKINLTFMIVDDEDAIRELVYTILTRKGWNVIKASDGSEAIKKLNDKIDVILLDIRMPGTKPKKMLEIIKKKAPNSVVIYLTSVKAFELTSEDEEMGWMPELEHPVIGYIEKPVNKDELVKKIEKYLKQNEFFKESLENAKKEKKNK